MQHRSDFSQVVQYVQESKVPLPDFIQQFITTWGNLAGIKSESKQLFAIQTFLNNVNTHIALVHKLATPEWQEKTWPDTVSRLMLLYRKQVSSQNGAATSS